MLRSVDTEYHKLLDVADRCIKGLCGSRTSVDQQELGRVVNLLVDKINEPDILFRLAMISWVSYHPGKAGLQPVDLVFETAWRLSVQRLGSLHTVTALSALRSLEGMMVMDGGVGLTVREAIENAEQGLKNK